MTFTSSATSISSDTVRPAYGLGASRQTPLKLAPLPEKAAGPAPSLCPQPVADSYLQAGRLLLSCSIP